VLLKDGTMPCPKCNHGTFTDSQGSQHVCRECNGSGFIQVRELVNKIIGRLRPALKRLPIISTEYSLMLRFTTPEDCLLSFQALLYHRIRALVILENSI